MARVDQRANILQALIRELSETRVGRQLSRRLEQPCGLVIGFGDVLVGSQCLSLAIYILFFLQVASMPTLRVDDLMRCAMASAVLTPNNTS